MAPTMEPTMDELVRQLQEATGLSGEEPSTCALGGKPRAFERFLIAHKLDVRAAAAALRDTLRFRAEHSLDDSGAGSHARKMVLAKVAPHWPGGLVTSIAGGSGVYYFGYGPLRPRKLMRDISESELRTFYLHFVEGMLAHMNAANGRACPTERWAGPVEALSSASAPLTRLFLSPASPLTRLSLSPASPSAQVHDLRGISLSTHFYPPGLAMLARVLSLGQRHVPDNLRKERRRGRGNELILHY